MLAVGCLKVYFLNLKGDKISLLASSRRGLLIEYYQNITKYDIDEEMPVVIQHRPTQEFPEKVEVVTLDSGLLLGHLEKEMAKDFVANYGNNFRLNGYIEEFELKSDEENFDADVDMMDEDLVTKIIVTYGRPRFRKVK